MKVPWWKYSPFWCQIRDQNVVVRFDISLLELSKESFSAEGGPFAAETMGFSAQSDRFSVHHSRNFFHTIYGSFTVSEGSRSCESVPCFVRCEAFRP